MRAQAEIGCVLWGAVRNAVKSLQHRGYYIRCTEGSGWLSRPFYFTGDAEALSALRRYFDYLNSDD